MRVTVLQLDDRQRNLLAPEMAEHKQAERTIQRVQRTLAILCPGFGEDPAVQFDPAAGAFFRIEVPPAMEAPAADAADVVAS